MSMRIFLILLAIFYIIVGGMLFIQTNKAKGFFRKLLKEKNVKTLSIVPLVVGLLLIWGSSFVSVPWFVILLGILGILKGLFFILGPEKKIRPLIDWWLNASDSVYKSWGVVAFLIGVLLLLIL